MNGALYRQWRDGAKPFDGQTVAFASEDMAPLPALRRALLTVVSRLRQGWPEAPLFTLDDWHEHDGFVSEARPTSWQDLSVALASDNALLVLSHDDFDVRRAFFPDSCDFYLRVHIPADYDNDHPERRGSFDVTGPFDLVAGLRNLAASDSGLPAALYGAKDFFDSRYGG